MQNRMRRQNSFTRWTAIGTAASAAIGMTAMDILVVTVLMGTFVFCQKTLYGSVCPPVLDGIATAAMCLIGISIVGFFVSAASLIVGLLGPVDI